MTQIYTKTGLEENKENLPKWQRDAFSHFAHIVGDKENIYPCILGRQGFLMDHLRFGFIGDPREQESTTLLGTLLGEYGECSRETGMYSSFVAFFDTPQDIIETFSITDYETLFWSLLSALSAQDSRDWPAEISTNPSHHSWEFCFHQEPYFAFCSTPMHKKRRSRYFPSFMITFQPRWVFKGINDSTPFGQKVKREIRTRLASYDQTGPHPDLKWYGQEDNHEWKQYFLRDDSSSLSKCPFHKSYSS